MSKISYLKMNNLGKIYHLGHNERVVALEPLDLSINQGEFVTIIGNNAAGKSTLLNLILGIASPSSGSIYIDGVPTTKISSVNITKMVTCVRQGPNSSLINSMTIKENLALAKRRTSAMHGLSKIGPDWRNEFVELLAPIDPKLARNIDILVSELSGGQKQTIALIMAVISKPKILLLDEHTASLDPRRRLEIMELTQKLIRIHKITTLMVTHDIIQAIEYGDRIIMFSNGKLILDEKDNKKQLTVEQIGELYVC